MGNCKPAMTEQNTITGQVSEIGAADGISVDSKKIDARAPLTMANA